MVMKMLTDRCVICGKEIPVTDSICIFTGKSRCDARDCYLRAKEYRDKVNTILADFATNKEILIRPLKAKLDTELFLLERDYLYHDG